MLILDELNDKNLVNFEIVIRFLYGLDITLSRGLGVHYKARNYSGIVPALFVGVAYFGFPRLRHYVILSPPFVSPQSILNEKHIHLQWLKVTKNESSSLKKLLNI